MEFEQAFTELIGNEGKYTNNPKDRGNWTTGKVGVGINKGTKFGIPAMTYPMLDIKNLTLDGARIIYYKDYWLPLSLDRLPTSIRFDMFDTGVNSGPKTAIKLLQRALKVTDDGVIGNITLTKAGNMNVEQLDSAFNGVRLLYIADMDIWDDFGKGLVRRVANNLIND